MSRLHAVHLRPLEPDDYPFLKSLAARLFGRYASMPVATLRATLAAPDAETIVAEDADGRAGFAIVDFHFPSAIHPIFGATSVAYLNAIAVRPDAQGRGIGRALLDGAESIARARNSATMSLNTAVGNAKARALFASAGYLTATSIDRYYAKGQAALAMFKPLL